MKANDIVKRMMGTLPLYTDFASDSVDIDSLTRVGTLVTVITKQEHNLKTGQSVLIFGAMAPVKIDTLTQIDGLASGVTDQDHDLTAGYDKPVSIGNVEQADYNLSLNMNLMMVPNRRNFSYFVNQAAVSPAAPMQGVDMLLFDGKERGYNGQQQVTVLDQKTFTYNLAAGIEPYSPAYGAMKVLSGVRVGASVHIQRFLQTYTKQDKTPDVWFTVCVGDAKSSNSRVIDIDAVDLYQPGSEYLQRVIEELHVYVIIKTSQDLTAAHARDMIEDIKSPLFKTLIGVKFPSYLAQAQNYGLVLDNHGFYSYPGPYYVHEFVFQNVCEITFADITEPDLNVAFRDIDLRLQNEFNNVIMQSDVNLDDQLITP